MEGGQGREEAVTQHSPSEGESPGAAAPGGGAGEAWPPAGVSEEDVEACARVLRALTERDGKRGSKRLRPTAAYWSAGARGLRRALAPLIEAEIGRRFGGDGDKQGYDARKKAREAAIAKRAQEREADRRHANNTALRRARLEAREALLALHGESSEALILDGPATDRTAPGWASESGPRRLKDASGEKGATEEVGAGEEVGEGSGARVVPEEGRDEVATDILAAGGGGAPEKRVLHRAAACYVCKRRFWELHHFYATLCPSCAALNWSKRNATTDMHGARPPPLPHGSHTRLFTDTPRSAPAGAQAAWRW